MKIDSETQAPDRALNRFIASFILDVMKEEAALFRRHDLGLIFSLVNQANIDAADEEALLQASAHQPAPDVQRRPISALAVAAELGMPRETVRRQVADLVQRGALIRVARNGVIVPPSYLERDEVVAFQGVVVRSFIHMASRMMRSGFIWPQADRRARPGQSLPDLPNFLIFRQINALALRVARIGLQLDGSVETALLMQAVIEANLADIVRDPQLSRQYASSATPGLPDALKRPASTSGLAQRTGIPIPTTKRLVRRAVEAGTMLRAGRGVVVPNVVLDSPRRIDLRIQVLRDFVAFAQRLAAVGADGEQLRAWAPQ